MLSSQFDAELGRDISDMERTVTWLWQQEQAPPDAGIAADQHRITSTAARERQSGYRHQPSRGMAGFSYSSHDSALDYNSSGSMPDAAAQRAARKPAPGWNASTHVNSQSLPGRLASFDAADRLGLQSFQMNVRAKPAVTRHSQDSAGARLAVPTRRAQPLHAAESRQRLRRRQAWSDSNVQIGQPVVHAPPRKYANSGDNGTGWQSIRSPRERQAEFARVAGGEAAMREGLVGAAGNYQYNQLPAREATVQLRERIAMEQLRCVTRLLLPC